MVGIKLLFTVINNSHKDRVYGLATQEAVDELALLVRLPVSELIAGKIALNLPDQIRLKTMTFQSIELQNTLNNFAGEKIYIHPENHIPPVPYKEYSF